MWIKILSITLNETIVNEEETRTLKNLCKDYSNMLENFRLYKTIN